MVHHAVQKKVITFSDLITKENESSCPFSSIMSSSLSLLQKVEVLELIGSAFVLYCPHTACHYGIPCLKQALVLRKSIEVEHSAVPKTIQPHSDPCGGHFCRFYPIFNKVLPLSCHCANVILRQRIPFDVQLPSRLHDNIRRHRLFIKYY